MWQAQTLCHCISIFLMALKNSCITSSEIQVFFLFCSVLTSLLLLSPQHLLQQIQHHRVSGAFGVGASGTQTQCLHSIYRDLRENPLIIL